MTKQDFVLVTFSDNSKARAVGIGSIGFVGSTWVEEVFLVKGLKYNLLSISQLCNEGNVVIFEKDQYTIKTQE